MTQAKTSRIGIAILRFLRRLEAGKAGFDRREVRGWATPTEINDGTGISYLSDDLAQLHHRGLVTRDDGRIPSTARPVWIYRITDAGAVHLAEHDTAAYAPVADPRPDHDMRVYVRRGVQAALLALRHAAQTAQPKPVLPDAPEWRTSLQLTQWLAQEGEKTGREERFFSEDLAWAVKVGLAERRNEPAILYRITTAGLAVQPIIWHDLPEEGAAASP